MDVENFTGLQGEGSQDDGLRCASWSYYEQTIPRRNSFLMHHLQILTNH